MKQFIITVLQTSTEVKGKEVIERLKNNEEITENVIFDLSDSSSPLLTAYLERISPETRIGLTVKVEDKNGTEYPAPVVKDLIESENYEAKVKEFIGNKKFTIEFNEIAEDVIEEEWRKDTTIEEEIERIIKEDICSQKELNERINVMRKNRVNDLIIRDVLAGYKKYDKEVKRPKTIFVDPEPKSKTESIMEQALMAAMINSPTIFEGIQSTGKNVCAETLAWVLGKPYFLIGIDVRADRDDIFGAKKTKVPEINEIPEDELVEMAIASKKINNGITVTPEEERLAARYDILKAKASSVAIETELSEFVEWLKVGGVLMINEMNMAEANFFQSFINPIGDNTGFINTGDGRLYVNPDCWLLGSQNDGFIGSLEQNSATKSRFGCIKFPATTSIKRQLIAEVGKCLDDKYFDQCDKLYNTLVKAATQEAFSSACLNIRGFCRALKTTARYKNITTLKQQLMIHVVNTCPSEEIMLLKSKLDDQITL